MPPWASPSKVGPRIGRQVIKRCLKPLARRLISSPRRGQELLLVLGAQRSGSSMLSEVLASHPEIAGIGEAHVRYVEPASLRDLALQIVYYRRADVWRVRYLMDKVLHDSHLPAIADVAQWIPTRVIVLTRDPAAVVDSMRRWLNTDASDEAAMLGLDARVANRYQKITEDVESLPATVPVCLARYEDLCTAPDASLACLSDFLGLKTPLTAAYQPSRLTGKWGFGDGSARIRAGRILTDGVTPRASRPASDIARWAHERLQQVVVSRGQPAGDRAAIARPVAA